MKQHDTIGDLALLAARLGLGGTFAAHGAQKMFGAFGGPGLEGAGKMFGSLGFQPGKSHARAASATEIVSGALIAAGALGPLGPAMLMSVMLVAIETVHRPKGYFNQGGGYEMNVMYVLLALVLATQGYGRLSIDALTGLNKKVPTAVTLLTLAGGIGAGVFMLSRREEKPEAPTIRVERGVTEAAPAGG